MARSSSTPPKPKPGTQPEHWSASAGTRDVARLDIPPDAHRDRTFEVFVSLAVHNRAERPGATHALRVLVNGALEWQRTVPTHPGPGDTLDLRLKRVAEEAIRRAKGGTWEGNVYKPRSFRKPPRDKMH